MPLFTRNLPFQLSGVVLFAAASLCSTAAAQRIGGFDTSRAGGSSFPAGAFFSQARSALAANFPGTSLIGFPVLTPAALANVDCVVLSSGTDALTAIVPLSLAEQNALRAFILDGGSAILLADNDTFSPLADLANESLLDPVGLDASGTLSGNQTAAVGNPAGHPATGGPFGNVATISQLFPGSLSGLAGVATPLANNSLGTALAAIEACALGAGAGRVLAFSDTNCFGDPIAPGLFPNNTTLFLNSIAFCLGNLATEKIRAGTPPNPVALMPGLTSGPVLGAIWDPVIEHTTFVPAALADLLVVTLHPLEIFLPPFGTLLCDPSVILFSITGAPGTPFAVPVPANCGLLGLPVCAQGASVDPLGALHLTNAIDATLGTR
jgi:hypothetical protein